MNNFNVEINLVNLLQRESAIWSVHKVLSTGDIPPGVHFQKKRWKYLILKNNKSYTYTSTYAVIKHSRKIQPQNLFSSLPLLQNPRCAPEGYSD